VDDHADVLGVTLPIAMKSQKIPFLKEFSFMFEDVTVYICLSRFWKLDDDGTYLITYNSTTHADFPGEVCYIVIYVLFIV
jgi:hypothetical protein